MNFKNYEKTQMGFENDEAAVNVDEKDMNDFRIKNERALNPPAGVRLYPS